ncbi:MAG: YcfL family protein [Limisphaerales bacterium]
MKNKLQLAAVALLGLAFAGCMEVKEKHENVRRTIITGHKGGAYEPRNTNKYDLENQSVFVLMDKPTQVSVTTSGVQERRLEDGRLEVVSHIRNRQNRRIQVQVSCVFKDAHGFSTGDETPWQNVILTENSQEDLRFISMNNQAAKYTIRVRQAR